MAYIETQSLSKTVFKRTVWEKQKRYVDDSFSLGDISKPVIVAFFAEQVNLHHPTMKFTAEISENETLFLETVVYQGTTFSEKWEKAILDVKTHFKRKPYSIYIFTSYHPPVVKAPVWQTRSLENPTNKLLWGSISDFKSAWWTEASHTILKEKLLLEVKLTERKAALLKKKQPGRKRLKYCLSWHNTSP